MCGTRVEGGTSHEAPRGLRSGASGLEREWAQSSELILVKMCGGGFELQMKDTENEQGYHSQAFLLSLRPFELILGVLT